MYGGVLVPHAKKKKKKSYVGLTKSYVGDNISYVGLIISYVGLIISYVYCKALAYLYIFVQRRFQFPFSIFKLLIFFPIWAWIFFGVERICLIKAMTFMSLGQHDVF